MNEKQKTKLGLYLCSLLIMGVIAVASNLANIIAAFPDVSSATVMTCIMSVPFLLVIPVSLISGKLMSYFSKKTLIITGISFWIIGGFIPYFLTSLPAIAVMRALLGAGIGLIQPSSNALIVEYFDSQAERRKTMGQLAGGQMLGTIIFSLLSGNLGAIGEWNITFLIYLVGIIPLIGAITLLPNIAPTKRTTSTEAKKKFVAPKFLWVWALGAMIFMTAAQTYSNTASKLIQELNLGNSIDAGYSLSFYAVGGLIVGLIFGKISQKLGKYTVLLGGGLVMVGSLLVALVPNLLISYVGAFLCGAAFSVIMPCVLHGAAKLVPAESSAMAVSIAICSQTIGRMISPYVMTFLGSSIVGFGLTSNQASLLFAVVVGFLGSAILYFVNIRK